jgi:hypothetical protein
MGVAEARPMIATEAERASQWEAADDFRCLRFKVSYPSIDCAFRTLYKTCPGCLDCEQGRFNLKRHRATLLRRRPLLSVK